MKVAIILGAALGMLPWNYFYLDTFRKYGWDVTVITWNREGLGNEGYEKQAVIDELKYRIDNGIAKHKKIVPFLEFRKHVRKNLSMNRYDLLVVSTFQIALLIQDILLGQYRRRYIYDVRDPWTETSPVMRKLSDAIVKNACLTFISSDGYRKFLPEKSNIVTIHNVRFQDEKKYEMLKAGQKIQSSGADKIQISYWGITREVQTNIDFINIIANDKRFQLNYYGILMGPPKSVFRYCKDKGIKNVHYNGEFPKDGRIKIAAKTNLIHNVYTSEKESYDTRVFNKYYDGIVFKIPQLVSAEGFMGDIVRRTCVGMDVNLKKTTADDIYNYYRGIDMDAFSSACRNEYNRVKKEQEKGLRCLIKAMEKIEHAKMSGMTRRG